MVADSIGWMTMSDGECGARSDEHKEIFTNALLLWPKRAECTRILFCRHLKDGCSFVSQYNFLF